jgi:hypothetical protein
MSNRRNERRRHKRNLQKAAVASVAATNTEHIHTPAQKLSGPETLRKGKIKHLSRSTKLVWGTVVVAATLFGVVAGAYSLRALIAVSAAPSLTKDAPYEPILTISNVGLTELYNLTFGCFRSEKRRADKNLTAPRIVDENHMTNEVGQNLAPESALPPQISIARTCALSSEMEGSHILSVVVVLQINYRPSFWPQRLTKFVRFRSRTDPSGQLQWIPDPQPDPFSDQ